MRPVFKKAIETVMQVFQVSQQPQLAECGFSGISPEGCVARGCSWSMLGAPGTPGAPACRLKRASRKVLLTTFVWGQSWATLLPSFVAWMHRLRLPTVVVAMGQACREACEAAMRANGGSGSSIVGCWDPFLLLGA